METIYKIITDNPGYFAWAFGIINALWVIFIYFNKKRHERELESLKHSYSLDLEKRKKMYEMKAAQFEKYFRMIDDFGKRQQVDIVKRMQPIINKFMEDYLKSTECGDKKAETAAIITFSSQISDLTNEGMEQYLSLKSETNSLKLIASDDLAILFDELQESYDDAFNATQEFMSKFVKLTMENNEEEMQRSQKTITTLGNNIKQKAEKLMIQMRKELNEI
jgi:predicted outer membrane lipoprotein